MYHESGKGADCVLILQDCLDDPGPPLLLIGYLQGSDLRRRRLLFFLGQVHQQQHIGGLRLSATLPLGTTRLIIAVGPRTGTIGCGGYNRDRVSSREILPLRTALPPRHDDDARTTLMNRLSCHRAG